MANITIVPNVGKGATVVWDTVPMTGDIVEWSFKSEHGQGTKYNSGVVTQREFDHEGDVTLRVRRGDE